jgi:hypothetical protein
MPSPAAAFHAAEEAALRGSAALQQAMGAPAEPRIYVEVPAGVSLPYVVRGQHQVLIENDDCAAEAEVFATVTLWSRKKGALDQGVQARAMGAAIVDVLNVQLTLDGWDVDEWELQSETYSTDPDQSTKGVLVFHYLLTKQVA